LTGSIDAEMLRSWTVMGEPRAGERLYLNLSPQGAIAACGSTIDTCVTCRYARNLLNTNFPLG
jgi:hypothetical protein